MKPEKVYLAWAPTDSIWSPWAIPVPFAQIVCVPLETEKELVGLEALTKGLELEHDLAVVVDLPGVDAVRLGLAAALRGFRPVPVIDGSPGPDILGTSQNMFAVHQVVTSSASTAVDMRQTMRWLHLCRAAADTRDHSERRPRILAGCAAHRPHANRWRRSFRQSMENFSPGLSVRGIFERAWDTESAIDSGYCRTTLRGFGARALALAGRGDFYLCIGRSDGKFK